MSIRNIFMTGVALLALTACSNDSEEPQNDGIAIRLQGTIGQMLTRSSQDLQNTRFKVNTNVDVQITSDDGNTVYNAMTYKVSDTNGTLVPTNSVYPYYPINGSGIKIRAIYPVGYMNESSFTVQQTQTNDESYMKSDLMFATAEQATAQVAAVNLDFYHKLTKICVNLQPGDDKVNLAGAQVKLLQFYTTVGFTPATGVIGDVQGGKADMLIQTGGEESTISCAAVVAPQNHPSGYLIEIRLANNDILNYRTTQNVQFESGKKYTYTINVKESGITVDSSVEPWLETDDIEGRPRL